jgi:hypothetical protein
LVKQLISIKVVKQRVIKHIKLVIKHRKQWVKQQFQLVVKRIKQLVIEHIELVRQRVVRHIKLILRLVSEQPIFQQLNIQFFLKLFLKQYIQCIFFQLGPNQ